MAEIALGILGVIIGTEDKFVKGIHNYLNA